MSPSRYRTAAAALSLAALVSACSSSAGGDAQGGGTGGGTISAAASANCTGKALKFTVIQSMSGPAAFAGTGQDVQDGVKAAVTAVNKTCQAGAPLSVTVCDDKSDPNQSTACGREAKADGSLALLATGTFDNGATASGLPAVFSLGIGSFDLTSPKSYPAGAAVVQVLGSLSAAKAAGAHEYTLVAFQSAQTQGLVQLVQALGAVIGVKVQPLFFPADTTDYAPIAAQIAAAKPASIGVIAPALVPLVNALGGQGITPRSTPMFTAVSLAPPSVIQQLGAKADGLYLISATYPANDTANAGIKQMLSELKAAGITRNPSSIGTFGVDAWSRVHMLAAALAKVGKAKVEALTPATVVDAATALGPVDRPEYAPLDLAKPAFGADFPPLTKLRVFSRDVLVVRIENSSYQVVSDFSDVTKPIVLQKG